MTAPIYDACDEMHEIIKKLMDEREDLFGEMKSTVWPEMFACGLREDKGAPENQTWTIKIEGIRGAKTLLTDKKYIIHGYKDRWDACSPEKKTALIANMLKRVKYPTLDEVAELNEKGKDFEFGKTIKPDIQDFSSFLDALGVGWEAEGSTIPNIASDKTVYV